MGPFGLVIKSLLRRVTLCCAGALLITSGVVIGCSSPETNAVPTAHAPKVITTPAAANSARVEQPPAAVVRSTPTPAPISTRSSEPSHTSTPPSNSSPTPTRSPIISPSPTEELLSLSLDLLAPSEGAGVEVGAVRVLGVTSPSAAVTVNGVQTGVHFDGTFQHDLILREGINSIEALATQPSGSEASDSVLVLFVPRTSGIPLSVLFPQGLEVSEPKITIIGATRQDAVVGVNGTPVEVNGLGIFSTEVALDLGANLVEVVAVDLDENVNFQTVVVFYIPVEGSIS